MAEAGPGRLIAGGRSADVYEAGDGRVLRRYRDGRPADRVAREAEVMAHARAHGVPVPEVFDVAGCDIVMERADGPTMLTVLGRRPLAFRRQARLLARLHAVVHAVPAPEWLPAPFGDGDGAQVLLHRDLHPQNVILTADGPRIIDWEGAARGPAVADVAMTWVIVGFSSVPPTGPERGGGTDGAGAVHQVFPGRGRPGGPGLAGGRRPAAAHRSPPAAAGTSQAGTPARRVGARAVGAPDTGMTRGTGSIRGPRSSPPGTGPPTPTSGSPSTVPGAPS